MESIELPWIADGEDKSSPFKNCLRSSYRHLRKWARRTLTNCFRIYDRQVGNYPLAIDLYDGFFCIHYFASTRDQQLPPTSLVEEVEQAIRSLFGDSVRGIYWRSHIRRGKLEQYQRRWHTENSLVVLEYGVKFKVNLTDYLDTGLFLDHRQMRQLVASRARGKKLLNLFAYTCSFSVHAAMQGAYSTKSVDLSNTYTRWGRENFELNQLPASRHSIVRADCLQFLQHECRSEQRYDLIVVDPPTLSRSKGMERMFDIQRDYGQLLCQALDLLSPEGTLFFSTNLRSFKLDPSQLQGCRLRELPKTLPLGFHDRQIHHCWQIERATTGG